MNTDALNMHGKGWFEMPAAFLKESGVVVLREPPDSDAKKLLVSLLEGTYRKPFVVDDGLMRRLYFSLSYVQSEMDIKEPDALNIAYTRKMMAFLLFVPRPRHIMIVGLGGGSLTKFCYRQLTSTRITTIEINEDVIAFGELFGVPQPDERLAIIHADAIKYLARTDERVDVILLDGCDKHGVAPAFCDAGFYDNLRARLKPDGMLTMNLVGANETSRTYVDLISDAFLDRVIVQDVSADGNRVAFAFNEPGFSPNWPSIERDAKQLEEQYGLDFTAFARKLQRSYQRQSQGRRR
ncbi:MAG: spermidine synthase-like protein [Rhodocyclales bacterium]|nr:spermidine synthase-like protein [Rhodocyclales bacterium]